MEDWIIRLVEWAGYWGVALLMLLETVFPPVPSEVIMTVAGVSAARGHMTLTGAILSGTAGAMLGNWFWYWVAVRFGEARLHDRDHVGDHPRQVGFFVVSRHANGKTEGIQREVPGSVISLDTLRVRRIIRRPRGPVNIAGSLSSDVPCGRLVAPP